MPNFDQIKKRVGRFVDWITSHANLLPSVRYPYSLNLSHATLPSLRASERMRHLIRDHGGKLVSETSPLSPASHRLRLSGRGAEAAVLSADFPSADSRRKFINLINSQYKREYHIEEITHLAPHTDSFKKEVLKYISAPGQRGTLVNADTYALTGEQVLVSFTSADKKYTAHVVFPNLDTAVKVHARIAAGTHERGYAYFRQSNISADKSASTAG